jgi:hypothetical protein
MIRFMYLASEMIGSMFGFAILLCLALRYVLCCVIYTTVSLVIRKDEWDCTVNNATGRATAQAVSRRLPTAAARVQTRVGTWDFVMEKSGAGAGFLRELRFPLPIYIPSYSPQSSSLSREAGTMGQEWPQCL